LPKSASFGKNIFLMSRPSTTQLPVVQRLLHDLGERLRLARLRRGLSGELVAERAGMSRPTLRAIERGDPSATLGAYANVLHVLGMHTDLALLARDDTLGRKLQDLKLPAPRPSRKKREVSDGT
jgi:transcriptional regulator with XRE-family HTH domain